MEKQLTFVKGFLVNGVKFAVCMEGDKQVIVALHGDAAIHQPVDIQEIHGYPEISAFDAFAFNGKPAYMSQGTQANLERLFPTHTIHVAALQRTREAPVQRVRTTVVQTPPTERIRTPIA